MVTQQKTLRNCSIYTCEDVKYRCDQSCIIDLETQSWILKLDKSKDDILLDSREELEDVFKA